MNSDKLDNFIKEQIGSLDRVEVPDTRWDKEASWDKIAGQSRKRKAGIFWVYFGGVAAVFLLLISLWFYDFKLDDSSFSQPMASENKLNTLIPDEIENEKVIEAKAVAESPDMALEDDQNVENRNYPAEKELLPTGRQAERQLSSLPRLYPQSKGAQIETSKEVIKKPVLRSSTIDQSSKQPEVLAFNRTYIIRKKSESEPFKSAPALTLSINMPMKSKIDPPIGFLSRLK